MSQPEIHRLVQSESCEIVDLNRPFSNFDYVEDHFGGNDAIRRLFSLSRRNHCNILVREDIPASGLIENENNEIYGMYSNFEMRKLIRLTFWREFDERRPNQNNLVGYAILKRDVVADMAVDRWHVFESVMPKYRHPHNCVPASRNYRVSVDGNEFSVNGVMYCQQNGLNKACAQVALKSLCSLHMPDTNLSFQRINELAECEEPSKGLSVTQIRNALDGLHVQYRDVDYTKVGGNARQDLPYQKYLYAGIESGGGALLGFRFAGQAAHDERHIIPFFGHTFNQDTWAPDADVAYFHVGDQTKYIPSESWMSSFIGHDDNFGSDYCVPRFYVSPEQTDYVVELFAPGIHYSGMVAEAIGVDYLYSILTNLEDPKEKWLQRLVNSAQQQKVVLRTVALDKHQYIQHLRSARDWEEKREAGAISGFLEKHLPAHLWMVEVSIPQLFPCNQRKLGEIVLNASTQPKFHRDFSAFILSRLPEKYVFLQKVDDKGDPHFLTTPSNLKSHTKLFFKH